MALLSNFPNGFDNGVLLRDLPITEAAPGKTFWVGNNATVLTGEATASDSAKGSFLHPLATIDAAVGLCKANRGDKIMVRPNHTETISAASSLDLDVAGISVIGLGNGSNRPRLDFTAAAGTVQVAADNIRMMNLNLHANVTTITGGLVVEDGVNHFRMSSCTVDAETEGTDEFNNAITLTNNNNRCIIEDCIFDMGIAAAVSAIHLDADTDNLIIRRCYFKGDYSTACIVGDTTLSTNLLIEDCLLINGEHGDLNAQPAIELLTGSTGVIRRNHIVCNESSPAAAIVADSCFLFENKYSETAAGFELDLPVKTNTVANVVVKTNAPMNADDLFDVNTGDVLIHELFAICTTVESGGSAPVVSLQNDVDSGTDYAIATGLDLALIAVSDSLNFASHGSVLVKTGGGAFTSGGKPFVCPAGVIESVLDSGSYSAGDMTWVCVWSPITSGATVTAAA